MDRKSIEDLKRKLGASAVIPSPFVALLLSGCGGGGGVGDVIAMVIACPTDQMRVTNNDGSESCVPREETEEGAEEGIQHSPPPIPQERSFASEEAVGSAEGEAEVSGQSDPTPPVYRILNSEALGDALTQQQISDLIIGKKLYAVELRADSRMDAGSLKYQWVRVGENGLHSAIKGATERSYTLTDDDFGKTISVVITYTIDEQNSDERIFTEEVALASPFNNLLPNEALPENADGSVEPIRITRFFDHATKIYSLASDADIDGLVGRVNISSAGFAQLKANTKLFAFDSDDVLSFIGSDSGDYEAGTSYVLILVTTDNSGANPSFRVYEVGLINVSEHAPIFKPVPKKADGSPRLTEQKIEVAEGGSVLLREAMFAVTDSDPKDNLAYGRPLGDAIIYTLESMSSISAIKVNGVAIGVGGTFTLEQLRAGEVRFSHRLADENPNFSLSVADSDGKTNNAVEEHKVYFLNSPPSSLRLDIITDSIKEDITTARTLALLYADEAHSFTISGDSLGIFEVIENRLQLKHGFALDYENLAHRSQTITLTAEDSEGVALASNTFTLSVTNRKDEDTNYLRFTSGSDGFAVTEHQAVGTLTVYNVAVAGPIPRRWEPYIIGEDAAFFEVHDLDDNPFTSTDKIIIFRDENFRPDYEHKSAYSITLVGYIDDKSRTILAMQDVTIAVTDAASDPITITSGSVGSRVLVDNQRFTNDVLYTARATALNNEAFTWRLEGADRSQFYIGSNGEVRAYSGLVDYERQSSYSLTVIAQLNSDRTIEARKDVTLEVQDAAEANSDGVAFFVRFTSPEADIEVTENQAVGDKILHTFTADNEDGMITPSLLYGDSAMFSLSSSGELRFSDPTFTPDYEARDSYNFVVTIKHPSDEAVKEHQWVTVRVENDPTDDLSPEAIPANAIELSVYENHPIHKDVYDLGEGDFALASGGDNALFEIRGNRIWFKAIPDFEAPQDVGGNNLYQIEVSGGGEVRHFAISVEDILLEKTYVSATSTEGGARKLHTTADDFLPEQLPRLEVQELVLGNLWGRSSPIGPLTLTWSIDLAGAQVKTEVPLPNSQSHIDLVRPVIERAFEKAESAANLKFIEVMDGGNSAGNSVGDISFRIRYDPTRTNGEENPLRHSGDAALHASRGLALINLVTPSSGYDLNSYLAVHEIGHILGLGHPFDARNGWQQVSYKLNGADTIMSYNPDPRYLEEAPFYPLDIETLQFLYGAPGDDEGGVESRYLLSGVVRNPSPPAPAPPSSGTGLSMWVIADSIVEGPTYPQALAVLSFTGKKFDEYSFALSGDEHNMFEIVGNKLRLKAGIALDYENEAHRSHSITLKAVDSGGKTLASQPFTLSVTDRKDEEMSYIRITSGSEGQVVTENEEPGGPIYTLTAEASGYWEATAIFENPRFFDTNIISPGRIISFASNHSPDYEYKSSYSFTVIAWLTYSPEVIATQHVTIQVQDAPDPVTITSGDRGSRVLVDNKPFGRSAVYNATVAIESTEDNDYVRWYLRGADADIFKISRTTGKVTPRDREALVNYENRTSYSFTVEAHLNSDPDVNVLRDVTIEVRDASEAGFFVSFTSDDSNIVIRENEAVGEGILHTFTGMSNVGTVAPIISRGDSHLFNLSSSGELRFKDATFIPDYEAKASYTFLVGMRHPKDNTIKEHKWVTISVENDPSDDVAPETIETDAVELSIYENHPIHKNVLHDLDSSPDLGGFALTEGYKDNHLFKITDDGRIWFKAAPDYENPQDQGTNNLYQIKVSDGDATHHFAITVEDIRPEGRLEDSGDRDAPYGGILIYGGALKRIVHRSEINPYELPPIEIQEMMYGEMWLKSDMSGPTTITWSLELDDFTKDERFIDSDKKLPSLDRQPVINKVRQGIERALEEFEAAANLEFIEVMGDNTLIGDIIFTIPSVGRTANGGAAAVRAGTDIPATVWVPVTRSFDLAPRYQVLVHEIGHALGLHHPFDGNHGWQENDLRYGDPYTTMSYGRHSDVQGLFPLDIDALQYLYGAPGDDDDGLHALYLDLV